MHARARERGLALLCALLLMLATMIVGLAVARTTFASIAAARFERERAVARTAAEAALLDAGRDIAEGAPSAARSALFGAADAASWPAGCGQGSADRGLCGAQTPPAWQALDLTQADNPALASYGDFTGAAMATGSGLLPARPPAYLIERLAAPGGPVGGLYRITAIGFGTRGAEAVVLQALYRKPDPGAPPSALPSGAVGRREIANWAELHAQAQP